MSGSGSWEIYDVLVGGENSQTLICRLTATDLPDGSWLDCPLPSPTPGPDTVYLRMSRPGSGSPPIEDSSYRIREVQIYTAGRIPRWPTPTPTFTFTPSPTRTPTPAFTLTPTLPPTLTATPDSSTTSVFTATAIPSPTPSVTPLATSVATLTVTPAPTATGTATATITSTPTPTALPIPTATATAGGMTFGPGAEHWMLPLGGFLADPDGPATEAPVEFTIILRVAAGRGYP